MRIAVARAVGQAVCLWTAAVVAGTVNTTVDLDGDGRPDMVDLQRAGDRPGPADQGGHDMPAAGTAASEHRFVLVRLFAVTLAVPWVIALIPRQTTTPASPIPATAHGLTPA